MRPNISLFAQNNAGNRDPVQITVQDERTAKQGRNFCHPSIG
jgi:hypothetical protein